MLELVFQTHLTTALGPQQSCWQIRHRWYIRHVGWYEAHFTSSIYNITWYAATWYIKDVVDGSIGREGSAAKRTSSPWLFLTNITTSTGVHNSKIYISLSLYNNSQVALVMELTSPVSGKVSHLFLGEVSHLFLGEVNSVSANGFPY